jgi:hypothetical protein
MSMDEQAWQELKRHDTAEDPLARLRWERDNHLRNAAGWRKQAERIRRAGHDPGDLLDKIAGADREANRVAAEILRVQRVDHDERQRAARSRYGDQARRVGEALPDKGKE